jgi:hypothetical protein
MKRVLMGSLAVVLAIGGCPGTQLPDPQPGVVSVLTAGSYSGPLNCQTVDKDGAQTNQSTVTGKVLVTAEGGLRLYDDNITPNDTLSKTQFGVTIEETIGTIDQAGDTLTMHTTGSITAGSEKVQTSRVLTLKQVDATTIQMDDQTVSHSDTTGNSLTSTCSGAVVQ